LLPDVGLNVHHPAFDDADQLVLDVTVKLALPDEYPTLLLVGETDNVAPAACVTVTTTSETPVAENVTFAVLSAPVLAVYEAATVALLLPEDGLSVHHVSLDVAVQLVFDVTDKLTLPAEEVTLLLVGVTERVAAAACVTVTTTSETPVAENVTFAVLSAPVLAVYEAATVALLLPEDGLSVHHVSLDVAVQLALDVTDKLTLPDEEVTLLLVGVTDRVVCPLCVLSAGPVNVGV
jgi:hypothetical protein